MRLITKKKSMEYIQNEIDRLKDMNFESPEDAFDYIHTKLTVLDDLKILGKLELNLLYIELDYVIEAMRMKKE